MTMFILIHALVVSRWGSGRGWGGGGGGEVWTWASYSMLVHCQYYGCFLHFWLKVLLLG